jgi:lyso-ornithine lipid O-acyltransferase
MVTPIRDRVRQATRAGGFMGLTAAMLPMMLADVARAPEAEKEAIREAWVKRWARALLGLFAIEVRVVGTVPAEARGRMVVANHRSTIDVGVLLATFGGTMVSRADLASWPLVGAAARSVGTVFVDRANAKSGASTIRAIQKHLEEGRTIGIFPEGTTFEGDDVHPFHAGAFVAAVRAEAEIIPVGLAYPKASGAAFVGESFPAHLGRLAKSRGTRMVVAVGQPFLVSRRDRAQEVAARASGAVESLVREARAHCGP